MILRTFCARVYKGKKSRQLRVLSLSSVGKAVSSQVVESAKEILPSLESSSSGDWRLLYRGPAEALSLIASCCFIMESPEPFLRDFEKSSNFACIINLEVYFILFY